MHKADVLCEKDSIMMHEFSRRSIDRVKARSPKITSIPFFTAFLDANVTKEIEKDCMIIREAVAAFETEKPACDLDLEQIFEKTKQVDRVFLKKIPLPTSAVSIRYHEVADVRIRRIWRIAATVYRLMERWPAGTSFTDAARLAYTRDEFSAVITDILRLYCEETRALSRSLRVIPPVQGMITSITDSLFHAMEEARGSVTAAYADKLYGDRTVYA